MIDTHKQTATRFLPILFGAGVALAAAATGLADKAAATATGSPFSCTIRATPAGRTVTIEPVVDAATPLSGSYAFTVESAGAGGSSNIRQGGGFTAGPDGAVTLGKVMLGSGGVYEANLEVTAAGRTVTCAERIGGGI